MSETIKWEYKIMTSFEDTGDLIRDLDILGGLGWELVSIIKNKNIFGITYTSYLKRIRD